MPPRYDLASVAAWALIGLVTVAGWLGLFALADYLLD